MMLNRLLFFTKTEEIDWDVVYDDQLDRIYNYFRYRVGDHGTAEDLTSTTFERAWHNRQKFRGDSESLIHWLYAIARNVANDYFRQSRSLVDLELVRDSADANSLTDQVEEQLEFARLVQCIRQLPEEQQELITLKYGANLNNRQIANQLKMSESNVGTILHRTIQKLRQQLEVQP